jgi:lysophospholipase L1-like esterase
MGERAQLARRSRGFVAALGILAVSGCGGSGTGPTPVPPPGAPTVSCPANIQALAHNGTPPNVTYDTPVAQGGQTPVTVACSPASGSTFQTGNTSVTCVATDSLSQTGSCAFDVTVSPVPRLSVTKFMAFGDSLTSGTTSPAPTILSLDESDSYPTKLLAMLSATYQDQTISMINEGLPGRKAKDDVSRFRSTVRNDSPEVVLLMHGANDLLSDKEAGIRDALQAIDEMVRYAKGRGVKVLLATLPPQNPAGQRGGGAVALPEMNRGLADTAQHDNVPLVDINAQMGTYVGYIGADGLHPTPVGYQRIAEIWRDAIQAAYEEPAAPAPSTSMPEPTGFRRRR